MSHDDYVADSAGHCYVTVESATQVELIKIERILLTSDVVVLIRSHEFVTASVCLTKIDFTTISDAIKSLAFLNDQ